MPELEIQKEKSGAFPWWLWLLLALLLIGLIWWAIAAMTPDRTAQAPTDTTTVATTGPAPATTDPNAEGAILPVDQIILVPANYFNQTVSGTTRVAEVVSDRGFWIEENGQRIFAVLDTSMPETPPDVNAGQRVFLQGVVRDASNTGNVETDARQALQGQKAYIGVTSLRILDQAAGGTGATTAGTGATTAGAGATTAGTPGATTAGATGQAGQTGQTTTGGADALPLASILQNPAGYSGQTVTGVATVPQVISDRGFWLESGGRRILAVLTKEVDSPEVPPNVNAGQTVRVHGTVHNANETERLADIDPDTRNALQGQQVFIRVPRIEILKR